MIRPQDIHGWPTSLARAHLAANAAPALQAARLRIRHGLTPACAVLVALLAYGEAAE